MAESASGQDGANLAFRLATPSFALAISRVGPASKSFVFGKIINPLLSKREVKMAEYWPRSFLHFIDLDE